MEKKTKKGMKRLLMSVSAMAIAIMGAATSAYAWFTMNVSPNVGEFRVQVTTVQGIEIALDTRTIKPGETGAGAVSFETLDYKSFLTGVEIEQYLKSTYGGSGVAASEQLKLAPSRTAGANAGARFASISTLYPADGDKYLAAGEGFIKNPNFGAVQGTSANDRAFFEFTLYFRADRATLSTGHNYVKLGLDMFDYSNNGFDKHAVVSGDVKTYVESLGEDEGTITYELPTMWLGDMATLQALHNEHYIIRQQPTMIVNPAYNKDLPPVDVNYEEAFVSGGSDSEGRKILAINMAKYLGEDKGNGTYDDIGEKTTYAADVFVDPSTGLYYDMPIVIPDANPIWYNKEIQYSERWTDGTLWTDAHASATHEMDTQAEYNAAHVPNITGIAINATTGASVPAAGGPAADDLRGQGANALRLSFSPVQSRTATTQQTPAALNTATEVDADRFIWDPRLGQGNFENNDAFDNFALHMFLAENATHKLTTSVGGGTGNPAILDTSAANVNTISGTNLNADDVKMHSGENGYFNKHVTNRANEVDGDASPADIDGITVVDEDAIGEMTICELFTAGQLAGNTNHIYGATTVRIWVDGWDAEAFNGIMADYIRIALQFKILETKLVQ